MQSKTIKLQKSPQAFGYCGTRGGSIALEDVEVLIHLGLTGRQARVYLALLRVSEAKAKTIADLSLVNRQEIYRILDDLQQIGIVQKNITSPTTFTATPLSDIAKVLLTQKTVELASVRQKTKQLIKKLDNAHISTTHLDKRPCLGTVFEGDRGGKYRQALNTVRQNTDMVTSWKRFKQLANLYEDQLQIVLQQNVTMRIVTEKPPSQPLPTWVVNNQNQGLKVKTLPTSPYAAVSIFDQTTVAIAFDPNSSLTKGPDLWTINRSLVALSQTYFDRLWMQMNKKFSAVTD